MISSKTGPQSITGFLTERRLTLFALLLITLLGAGLRFYNLGAKSLVPDEIHTVTLSARGLPYIWQNSRGVPVLFLITHLVLLLSDSEFILRMPSALEGVLGIVVLYKVGETIYGRKEGLIAAFLLALSAYHLRYSQDLRFYPLLVLLSLLTLLFLWKALEEGKRKVLLGFVLATAANLYNHVFAWLVLASEVIFAACTLLPKYLFSPNSRALPLSTRVRGALRPFLGLVALLALVAVLYLPAISHFIVGFFRQEFVLKKFVSSETEMSPSLALTWQTLSVSFFAHRIFGPFGAGTGLPLTLYGGAFLLGLARSHRKQVVLALLWIGLPFVTLPIIGIRLFHPRYVLYILPIYLIVISRGLRVLSEIFAGLIEYFGRTGSTGKALILGLLVGLYASLNLPPILHLYRQRGVDWREVADYLMTNVEPGHWILCDGHAYKAGDTYHCRAGLTYYWEGAFRRRHTLATDSDIGRRIAAAGADNYGIWIVVRHTRPLNREVAQHLRAEGALTDFHWATVVRVDQGESLVENAVSALKTLIELQPRPEARFDLHLSLAEIYARQGDLEQAQQALAAAREVQPHHYAASARLERVGSGLQVEYHLGLGEAYLTGGRAQEAVEEYRRALALDSNLDQQAWFHRVLGDACLASGKAREAAQEYERALSLEPQRGQRAGFHLRLGEAYRQSGRREAAIREYERVLELEPDNVPAQRALDVLGQ